MRGGRQKLIAKNFPQKCTIRLFKFIANYKEESKWQILRQLCNNKVVDIIEGHLMPDYIHILVSIPPKYSVSQIMEVHKR